MNLTKFRRIIATSAALCVSATMAHAINTLPGFPLPDPSANSGTQLSGLGATGPYGSYDAPGVGFAAWEKWATGSFSDMSPQYTGAGGPLNVTLSQSNTGAGVSTSGSNPGLINVGGVDYYGRLTTGGYDFALTGSSEFAFTSMTLQIKHTPLFDIDFNPVTAFSATLNGLASEPVVKGPNLGNFSDAIGLNTTTNVYSYVWNGLSIGADETFDLAFSSGPDVLGFGFSVDSIALSVAAVPEPQTCLLIVAAGLLLLVMTKRRSLTT